MFREGRQLMTAGKVAEACAAFEQSQKLEPAITTLLNLAGCREKLGQLATAWGLFMEAERQTRASADKASQQFHDVAQDRAKKLESRVSKLTINVPDQDKVDGLEIKREQERVDAVMWNRALPVDGGTYTITVKAPGAAVWSTKVTIGVEGDTKTVDVPDLKNLPRDVAPPTATASNPAPPPPEEPVQRPASGSTFTTKRKIAVAFAGVAVVGAVGGVVLGTQARAKENEAYDLCPDPMMACADAVRANSLIDAGQTRALGANIAFGVAGAAAIGAAVLWFTGAAKSSESVAFVPSLGSLTVVGRF